MEKETLADLSKLYFFSWRVGVSRKLSTELRLEYEFLLKKYGLKYSVSPGLHIARLAKEIMRKLQNDIKNLDRHVPIEYAVHNGFVISVKCTCGELTKYRVPLKVIEEFHCPKEKETS